MTGVINGTGDAKPSRTLGISPSFCVIPQCLRFCSFSLYLYCCRFLHRIVPLLRNLFKLGLFVAIDKMQELNLHAKNNLKPINVTFVLIKSTRSKNWD
jgi:hypothetical protein